MACRALFFRKYGTRCSCDWRRNPEMSAPLIVSIPHRLGREEATRRLKAGLTRAVATIPVLKVDEERWEQDRRIFLVRPLGQPASAHSCLGDDPARLAA